MEPGKRKASNLPYLDSPELELPDTGQRESDTAGIVVVQPDTSVDDSVYSDPGKDRLKAPELTLPDITGEPHSLSTDSGKVVVAVFWAPWCGPCRKEIPYLVELYNTYNTQGLEVLSIGLDRRINLERFVSKNPIPYTVLLDEDASSAETYHVSAIPRSIVIDKKGRIAFDHTGYSPDSHKQLEQEIITLLAEEY
ncbi:TlpA family protein disulfide reductase [candidate division WOR-3 bacterium]|nr:TlpA family protein disulfide reductase [candidate division WOR-3 bacterium]